MSLPAFEPGSELVKDAAFLSMSAAYEPGASLQAALAEHGWTLLQLPSAGDYGLYTKSHGVAFAAEKGDILAVAISGTEIDLTKLLADLRAGAFDPEAHYQAVLPYINEAISDAKIHPHINKILITGHSLGGQAAELFAVDPAQLIVSNLGRFEYKDVSIVTFGSPGIQNPHSPIYVIDKDLGLQSRVLNIYNDEDLVYGIVPGNVHVGTQKPFYNPHLNPLNPLDLWEAHNLTYQNHINAVADSKLSYFANAQTIHVFGKNLLDENAFPLPHDDVLDASNIDSRYSISAESQHFLLGLAGNDTLIGGAGDDLLDGGPGDDSALFGGNYREYSLATFYGTTYVTGGADGADSLTGIEALDFLDRIVSPPENRSPLEYVAGYGDLVAAIGSDPDAGLGHYLGYGRYEGREVAFDALEYVASHGDLVMALGANRDVGAAHYINYGYYEGRAPDAFNATQYLTNYTDLQAAFGSDIEAATTHYIEYGFKEGRIDDVVVPGGKEGGFEGGNIRLMVAGPTVDTPALSLEAKVTGDGVEFPLLPAVTGQIGTVVEVQIDLFDNKIDFDFSKAGSGQYTSVPDGFNGYVFDDINNSLPPIVGVDILEENTSLALENNDVAFSEDRITVNVESLPFDPSSTIQLALEFGGADADIMLA